MEAVIDELRVIMRTRRHLAPGAVDTFSIDTSATFGNLLSKMLDNFGAVVVAIAGISLVIGGIVIMNIMLVSVTERTREIGTRKAMGATKRDILRQFFAESAMLTIVSGVLGLSFGMGICAALEALPLPDFVPHPIVSWISIVASIVTLSLITVTAGMYPAQRAAEMTPVESLRYE